MYPSVTKIADVEASDCPVTGCGYKTNLLRDVNAMMRLIEMHVAANHSVSGGGGTSSKSTGREKVKRPALALDISEDDWSYWRSRWADYKLSTNLKPTEILVEIRECLEENLRRELHRQHPGQFIDEDNMLVMLKLIAVKKRNTAVIRNQLDHLTQDRGEDVQQFLGRVQALANVAEFSV